MRPPEPEDGPDAAERYRAALIAIFREVCESPWTVNGRKAWIRTLCQEALGVRYPQELPEQNALIEASGET